MYLLPRHRMVSKVEGLISPQTWERVRVICPTHKYARMHAWPLNYMRTHIVMARASVLKCREYFSGGHLEPRQG